MMPTPGAPRSCAQQANEHPNTASYGVQSDPAIVAPSRAGSCREKQTTSTGTQDTQGPGTSTATGHSATSAPKLRYDGAKCGPTTTTSTDVLDLREQIIILNREVEQLAAKYRELEGRYQREKREWQQTVESLREDLNTNNSQMDQFSHQLSSLTEYVRAMGPSSSGSRVPAPPSFTFPSSHKSAAPGRKLPPILQPPGQSQGAHMEDNSNDLDDSDEDYLDEYE